MKPFFKFLIARMSEPSTYKGAVLLATAAGAYIRPEIAAAVTSLGLAVAGLLGVVLADPASPATPAE